MIHKYRYAVRACVHMLLAAVIFHLNGSDDLHAGAREKARADLPQMELHFTHNLNNTCKWTRTTSGEGGGRRWGIKLGDHRPQVRRICDAQPEF